MKSSLPAAPVSPSTLDQIPVPTIISAYRVVNSRRRHNVATKLNKLASILAAEPSGLPPAQAQRIAEYIMGL